MHYFDNKLTQDIADWLNTPEDNRDVKAGADMMLSLNRNRALYNTVLRNPAKYMPKLVYELRKYLRMRIDKVTAADAAKIEAQVLPRVEKMLEQQPAISAEDELPDASVAKGKRADHDSLPADIRALWESNGQLHRRIVLLFNELKAMSDALPCDRYEKVRLLAEADKTYRANLERYDSFVAPAVADNSNVAASDISAEKSGSVDCVVKAIGAARKRISQYRKQLSGLGSDDPKRPELVEKIQSAVDVILSSGADLSDATKTELRAEGISC